MPPSLIRTGAAGCSRRSSSSGKALRCFPQLEPIGTIAGRKNSLRRCRPPFRSCMVQKGAARTSRLIPYSSRSPALAKASPESRLLTEFPGLMAECLKDLKDRRFSDKPLAFLLTCENGMGPGDWATEELNARRFVACRMLWQLRGANQQEFDDAGVCKDFAQFRVGCRGSLSPMDVIATVLMPEQMKRATVVMGVDGMQKLPGFARRGELLSKHEPFYHFYQVMQEVCRLVNQDTCPFVVACVTATQSVSQGLADGPQARVYLKLPQVMAVTRQQVAAIPDHPLKDLLTMDMGGRGRALECLEETLKVMPSTSASALVGAVMRSLRENTPML